MLRADPVSTRKYLRVLESKTWRSELLTPADKLFTVDRLGSFPSSKLGTCTVGYRILHVLQTLSGTGITRVDVATFGLTWYLPFGFPGHFDVQGNLGSCSGHFYAQGCGDHRLH